MFTTPQSIDQTLTMLWDLDRKVDRLTALLAASIPKSTTTIELPDLLTIKQASEFVNLAVPTIYTLVGRNEIPFMKPGRKLYFSRKELESWIREGRKKTTEECADEAREDLKIRRS